MVDALSFQLPCGVCHRLHFSDSKKYITTTDVRLHRALTEEAVLQDCLIKPCRLGSGSRIEDSAAVVLEVRLDAGLAVQ